MEYLTGGDCMAGMHEVVVTEKTTEAIKQALEQNRSLWRVSSTVSDLNHNSNQEINHHYHYFCFLFSWHFRELNVSDFSILCL